MGFVQALVAPEAHAQAVEAQVTQLLALAPLAQQLLKASLNEVARGDFDADRLRARMDRTRASADFQDACRAFAERRTPVFTGH